MQHGIWLFGWWWKPDSEGCSDHDKLIEALEEVVLDDGGFSVIDDGGCNIVDDEDKGVRDDGGCNEHPMVDDDEDEGVPHGGGYSDDGMVVEAVYEAGGGGSNRCPHI